MATVIFKQCDLCDVRNSEDGMFERIGDVDVCVGCINIFKRAVEHNLIYLVPHRRKHEHQAEDESA